ncbi:pyridoxal phosphate-dependent decarboxylase family protein [Microlunatus soli]|uniref:L-2,4-diaminobutyrate decarboxylase n=1 Tax=Microlunatus soli TaxID=630515 RepID=A0A1H1Q612_9ACTN|nr:aspartate aminotransferase family protein [Microlunatus soli]SDS18429.1 L-2,4-diaminobutyrate decarboxylase [Microlunatus soli]
MHPHLFSHRTVDDYDKQVRAAVEAVSSRIQAVRQPRTAAAPEQLQALVDGIDLDRPTGDTFAAIDEAASLYLEHAVWFHHPDYLAHLNCPVALPALAADAIASAVNTSVDTWDQSTSATLMEQKLITWTGARIGFDEQCDGIFTSGGTQSNLQAMLLARDECRRRSGLRSTAGFCILATDQTHFSVAKAAGILGLPDDAVRVVSTDRRGRMRPDALTDLISDLRAAGKSIMAVSATAGTTDRGVIDPLPELAAICTREGIWLHVDAAYGCGLLVSRQRRSWLDGIERADSVTVDYHKSFGQPVACSAVLVRRAETMQHAGWHADYLNPAESRHPNLVDKSLQTTRRFDAFKLWLTLRATGPDLLGDAFDQVIDLATGVAELIDDDPVLELLQEPTLSTVLFRYLPEDGSTGPRLLDAVNTRIREELFASGRVLIAKTRINGSSWLKLTLLNPETGIDGIASALELIKWTGRRLIGSGEFVDCSSDGADGTGIEAA